jgi:Na+-transporting methylmalonyl-CoA/oxaloacetate decarboxylase gamma subunit
MNPSVPELLRQGLIMTVLGMGLVFAALGLLWGIMALLTRVFKDAPGRDLPQVNAASVGAASATAPPARRSPAAMWVEAGDTETLTAERARVAAIVAGALIANAVPLLMEVPPGPVFEHGRTAPIWVSANRARALQSWQPQRAAEAQPRSSED